MASVTITINLHPPSQPLRVDKKWVARLKLRPRQDGLAPNISREVLCCIQLGAPKAA